MSSEFSELLAIWYTEEELQERRREVAELIAHEKAVKEVRREIAEELIQSGMSLKKSVRLPNYLLKH